MNQINYLVLSVSLIVWCVLHSALISNRFSSFLSNKFGTKIRFYRISFNVFSLVTFIPIVLFSISIQSEYFYKWTGYLQLLRSLVFIISLYLFYAGSKHYNALKFLGVDQIKNSSNHKSLSDCGNLDISGILRVIRHPWYSASILIIWTRNLDVSSLIVNIILTSYLIIGTYLEERKLVAEFSEKYQLYQQNVSMLFPYKWLKSIIIKEI